MVDRFRSFDTVALYEMLDAQRDERDLSWAAVARQLWDLDADLNRSRPGDHPFSAATIRSMRETHRTSCQHALFMSRWLDRAPECFLTPPAAGSVDVRLPPVPPGRRLRWSLQRLHAGADHLRHRDGLTWTAAADVLGCTPSQLTRLRTAKFATGIDLAMRIVQWSGRPSTDFLRLAGW